MPRLNLVVAAARSPFPRTPFARTVPGARLRAALLLVAALPLLASCGLFGGRAKQCHERQGYEDAQSVPPLRNPDGTPVQATRNALKIPEVSQTAKARGPRDACMDEPPSFYPGRPKPGAGAGEAKK